MKLSLVACAALLSACGHVPVPYKGYEGPQKPQNEVATVQADWLGAVRAGYKLVINKIDGQDTGAATASPLDPREQLVSVTPGPHTIGVTLSYPKAVPGNMVEIRGWNFALALDAKADRLYSLCLTKDFPPRVELVEAGPTSPRVVSQEEWQKYVMAPCAPR